jgi:tRNA uridine 5-carbamoylmethylation protein Kti12
MKSIVLLSGAVGAGKTTIAKQLVAISNAPVSYIEGDEFWKLITKDDENGSRGKNFKMIMTAMIAAALPIAMYGYEVIVDFSIPPWFLETVHTVVKGKAPIHYIVLRPSEAICKTRAANRSEGIIEDYSRYQEFYRSFDSVQRHIICDDVNGAAVVAANVREAIDAGMFLI